MILYTWIYTPSYRHRHIDVYIYITHIYLHTYALYWTFNYQAFTRHYIYPPSSAFKKLCNLSERTGLEF